MSKCISREGEYGDHVLGEPGPYDEDSRWREFTCTRCAAFDEDLALDEIHRLRGLVASQPTEDRAAEQDRVERMQLDLICGALIGADIARTTDFPGAEERRDIFDLNRQAKALLQRINNVASPGFFPAATEEPTTSDGRNPTCVANWPGCVDGSDDRNPGCVFNWPDCVDGDYNPACCRFPKSCSCGPRVASPTPDEATE